MVLANYFEETRRFGLKLREYTSLEEWGGNTGS